MTATTTNDSATVSSFKIEKEQTIAAPIEIVFQAMLDEMGPESQARRAVVPRPRQQQRALVGPRAGDQAADLAGGHRPDADVVPGGESPSVPPDRAGRRHGAEVHASGHGFD
jgi:hypothetical protein